MENTKPACRPVFWDSLSNRKQDKWHRFAQRIALRESRRLAERYGPNVISVGVGFRNKGRHHLLSRELTIRFFVRKKWRRGTKNDDPSRIPSYLSAFGRVGRGRVEYRIRTDVNVTARGALQSTTVKVVAQNGGQQARGSVCCMVRDRDTREHFLLSCNHIFGLVDQSQGCVPYINTAIDVFDPHASAMVARLRDLAAIYPGNATANSLDAALARCDPAYRRDHAGYPATRVMRDASVVRQGMAIRLNAGKSSPRWAEVVSVQYRHRVEVECNGILTFWQFARLIEYRTKPLTKNGDSGSSLLDGPLLVGMHFYARQIPPLHAFAMFATDILQRTVFGRSLELVPG